MTSNTCPVTGVAAGGGDQAEPLTFPFETILLEHLPALELAVPDEGLRRREGLLAGGLEAVPVRW